MPGGVEEKVEKPEGGSEGKKETESVTTAAAAESPAEEGKEHAKRHSTEDVEETCILELFSCQVVLKRRLRSQRGAARGRRRQSQ